MTNKTKKQVEKEGQYENALMREFVKHVADFYKAREGELIFNDYGKPTQPVYDYWGVSHPSYLISALEQGVDKRRLAKYVFELVFKEFEHWKDWVSTPPTRLGSWNFLPSPEESQQKFCEKGSGEMTHIHNKFKELGRIMKILGENGLETICAEEVSEMKGFFDKLPKSKKRLPGDTKYNISPEDYSTFERIYTASIRRIKKILDQDDK